MKGQQTYPLIIYILTCEQEAWMAVYNGATGSHSQPIYELTVPTQPMTWMTCEGWPHHQGLRPLVFSNSGVGSFKSHKNQISVSAVRRDLQFFISFLRRLESLTICKCHYKGGISQFFFFSVIQRPWVVVRTGFETATSSSADRRSPN